MENCRIYFLVCWWFIFSPLCPLQGSITDDKSKATHHIYPSPSQQEEGRVEFKKYKYISYDETNNIQL